MKFIVIVVILLFSQPYSIHTQCISFRNTMYKTKGTNCGQRCADRNVKNPTCSQNVYSGGCYCKPGYYRDATWNCVPGQQCDDLTSGKRNADGEAVAPHSSKPEDCPPNNQYSECGNYCTEKCRNINDKYCPQNICDVGCFCIDGYFRTDDGECVPQQKCGIKLKERDSDSTPAVVCPFSEQYERCAYRCHETCGVSKLLGCRGQRCEPGCFCKQGNGRNIQGDCVPRKDCKKAGTCKRHEEFKFCGNLCAEQCNPPEECPDKCTPGCYCKQGYLRNKKRNCVSDGSKIHSLIVTKITDRMDGVFKCELSDKPKSEVSPRSGPVKCKANEEKKKCGSRCGESCDFVGKSYVCPLRKICDSGCFCKSGFHRNAKNKCVTAEKCDMKNKKDSKELDRARKKLKKSCQQTEEYSECGNHCIELCNPPTVCPNECEFGCFCREGFFRNSYGECVEEKSCLALPKPPPRPQSPVKCGIGEKYVDCDTDCIQNCVELKDKNVCPIRRKCLFGCLCMRGHYRDASGQCVKENVCMREPPPAPRSKKKKKNKQAKIPDCNKNEDYLTCGNYCIELCKPQKKCPKMCQSGCFCKARYFRNAKGSCVPEKKCEGKSIKHKITLKIKDKCLKENEVLKDCGFLCGQKCSDQAKHVVCPRRQSCQSGCFCTPGHYRHRNGECVPISKCRPRVKKYKPKVTTPKPRPPQPECRENEQFDECGDHCIELCKPPDSCEASCESGCFCETGFYRAKPGGPCIPEDKCPKEPEPKKFKMKIKLKCEENEIYDECGTRCGQMCIDLFKSVICPKKGLCVGGCFCQRGYFRNEKGKCVLESQCPDTRPKPLKPLTCDDNEEFKDCGKRCEQSCELYLKKSECPSEAKCNSGCFCKEGFYKDQYGNCIDPKDCVDPSSPAPKPAECSENEKFIPCGNRCGQTCEELSNNITCTQQMRSCVSGCLCEKGFRRNDNGVCVPEDECDKPKTRIKNDIKCEDNEIYSKCQVRCAQSCDDLGRKIECPKERQCASGCFCKEGLFRNEIGDCIPENECPDVGPPYQIPKKLDCGPNEDYTECGTTCGQACDELGRRVTCPKRRICISGCFCIQGHFRTYSGECVPMLECPNISPPKRPPPSCDANEEQNDCGHRCGQSCDDFKNKKNCPKKQICIGGCFCDPDYKRDHNGNCVLQDSCPVRDRDEPSPESIKCGKNEEYNECGARCGQGCEDLISDADCSKQRQCVSGCFCLDGHFRNEIGECVPENQCPSPPSESRSTECGENEKYTDCGSACGQSCEDVGKPLVCPRKRMCIAGCFCKRGFYRNKYDSCVTQRQCSAKGGEPKKLKKVTTERPEEEDTEENTEDATDDESEEPHSEDQTNEPSDEEGSDATDEDNNENTTEESDKESPENSEPNEDSDESPTEKPKFFSGIPEEDETDDNSNQYGESKSFKPPEEETTQGTDEGSKESATTEESEE